MYLHIQDLPNTASILDVQNFFPQHDIPRGGIWILGGETGDAFVTFGSQEELLNALGHDFKPLQGRQLKLSLADRSDIENLLCERFNELEVATQSKTESMASTDRRGTETVWERFDHPHEESQQDLVPIVTNDTAQTGPPVKTTWSASHNETRISSKDVLNLWFNPARNKRSGDQTIKNVSASSSRLPWSKTPYPSRSETPHNPFNRPNSTYHVPSGSGTDRKRYAETIQKDVTEQGKHRKRSQDVTEQGKHRTTSLGKDLLVNPQVPHSAGDYHSYSQGTDERFRYAGVTNPEDEKYRVLLVTDGRSADIKTYEDWENIVLDVVEEPQGGMRAGSELLVRSKRNTYAHAIFVLSGIWDVLHKDERTGVHSMKAQTVSETVKLYMNEVYTTYNLLHEHFPRARITFGTVTGANINTCNRKGMGNPNPLQKVMNDSVSEINTAVTQFNTSHFNITPLLSRLVHKVSKGGNSTFHDYEHLRNGFYLNEANKKFWAKALKNCIQRSKKYYV